MLLIISITLYLNNFVSLSVRLAFQSRIEEHLRCAFNFVSRFGCFQCSWILFLMCERKSMFLIFFFFSLCKSRRGRHIFVTLCAADIIWHPTFSQKSRWGSWHMRPHSLRGTPNPSALNKTVSLSSSTSEKIAEQKLDAYVMQPRMMFLISNSSSLLVRIF